MNNINEESPVLFSCTLWNPTSKESPHVQVHERVSIHAKRGVIGLGVLVHLLMVPQVGLAGKALVTQQASEGLLFGVDSSMTYELSRHAERLPALQTLVALGLRMNAPVVLQSHQVGELFLADGAKEGAHLVAVFVIEEGASMAVSAAAVLTDVGLLLCTRRLVTVL